MTTQAEASTEGDGRAYTFKTIKTVKRVPRSGSKTLTEEQLTWEGSLIGAKRDGTKNNEDATSSTKPEGIPPEQKSRARRQSMKRRTDGAKSRDPMGWVRVEMKEGRVGILAKDGGRRGWSEEKRKRAEGMSKTDENARSNEEVEGESGCWNWKNMGELNKIP